MIGIIDYGSGNIFSIQSALQSIGFDSFVISRPEQIAKANKLILPGVGAFPDAMSQLRKRQLIDIIKQNLGSKEMLGICVGMQVLFSSGTEYGLCKGLDLIPGKVMKIDNNGKPAEFFKIPHIGWAPVYFSSGRNDNSPLTKGIKNGQEVYFAHSFHAVATDPADVIMTSKYGVEFNAVVNRGNIYGLQFHPEKSSNVGLLILKNFCNL